MGLKTALLSPFVQRYRIRQALSKVPEPLQSVLMTTVQSDDGKLVYVKNSKAACTTIAMEIYRYSKGVEFEGRIHRERDNFRQGLEHFEENRAALQRDDNTKFTFVRHPEKRAISAFKNFFVDRANLSAPRHIRALSTMGYDPEGDVSRNFDIYLDYVSECFAADLQLTDRHFRKQTLNIGLGVVGYDFIGRVEQLDSDLRKVFEIAGVGYSGEPSSVKVRNSSGRSAFSPDTGQRRRLQSLYADDYEAFEYD